jgi:hypothetical protein
LARFTDALLTLAAQIALASINTERATLDEA